MRRDFPPGRAAEVLAILNEYGKDTWQREPDRVRLAALKLAAGNVERLRDHVESAKRDYRDLLAFAEYPGYGERMFGMEKLPPTEQERIIEADWRQYQDWLTR